MIKITRKNSWICIVGAVIVLLLVAGFTRAVLGKGLESSEAAGWMQAMGSLAAIAGGFGIVQMQHANERLLDVERRALQVIASEELALTARILALRNVVQVATQALDVLRKVVDDARYPARTYAVDHYQERLEPIARILDGFVTPLANHIAVLAALNISLSIAAVQEDLRRVGGSMSEELLTRCDMRIADCHATLANLIDLQTMLLKEHNDRGFQTRPV